MKQLLLIIVCGISYTLYATDSCTVTTTCTPLEAGIVMGGGIYERGQEVRLEAKSNSTYRFLSWSDGSSVNPRNILALNDTTFTARFAKQVAYNPRSSAGVRITYDDSKIVRDTAFVTITPTKGASKKSTRRR